MCYLFSLNRAQAEVRASARAMRDGLGNFAPKPAVYPDYSAAVVRTGADGVREMVEARWGMPTPPWRLKGKTDKGLHNVRNAEAGSYWDKRGWLEPRHRCLVPFTAFAEVTDPPTPAWFAFGPERPLSFFAGIWTAWTGVRKLSEGEVTIDVFAFLTTDANAEIARIQPDSMPVILTTEEQLEYWMTAPAEEALKLQRPLADGCLQVVGRGADRDPPDAELDPKREAPARRPKSDRGPTGQGSLF